MTELNTQATTLTAQAAERVFMYSRQVLPDPNPELEPDAVMRIYAAAYPELHNALVSEPRVVGSKVEYEFIVNIGTKGLGPVVGELMPAPDRNDIAIACEVNDTLKQQLEPELPAWQGGLPPL